MSSALTVSAAESGSEVKSTKSVVQDTEKASAVTPLPSQTVIGESDYLTRSIRSATKTETPLQDLPQAVSVVPRKMIEDLNLRSISDTVRYVPGAAAGQGEGNRDTIILRAGAGSTADYFVDGVRDDVQYYRDFYNVERVEVLKGPSAVVFGRGGSGGVLNRVTRVANGDEIREISLQTGSFGNARVSGDFGQGFNDQIAGRVTGVYEHSESYRDYVKLERYGFNPTLAWKLDAETQLLFSYEYFHDHRTADRGVPSQNGQPFATRESAFFGNPNESYSDADIHVLGGTLDHAFSNTLTLRNTLRAGLYDKFYQNVYANSAVSGANTYTVSGYNQATARQNLFNQTDLVWKLFTGPVKHTVLSGVELGRQASSNLRLNAANIAGVSASSPTIFTPSAFNTVANNNEGTTTLVAVYVQDQIEFNEQWLATAGLRFDSFELDFRNKVTNSQVYSYDGLVSPRAGLVYKPLQPLSLYASYSITYLPVSGEQMTGLTAVNAGLKPEKDTNYEIGAKWQLHSDLALNLALYQLQRQDFVVTDPNNAALQINVDGTTTLGVEVGINGNITKRWSIAGGYAYQNSTYDANQSATVRAGNRTANVPLNSASLWNRYDFSSMWGAGLGLIHRSSMYAATDNAVRLPGYTRADAALFFTLNPQFSAQLNVENLFDRRYHVNAHTNNNIQPGGPIAARVSATYTF